MPSGAAVLSHDQAAVPVVARLASATPAPDGPGSVGWVALQKALASIGLGPQRWGLVLVGGAGGLDPAAAEALSELFNHRLAPILGRGRGMVVDGGTDSGVMALMGAARSQCGAAFPLLGVAPSGAIVGTEDAGLGSDAGPVCPTARLDHHHSHALLVPGLCWGDEVPWLAAAASVLIPPHRCLTLVCGGGAITRCDVAESLMLRRSIVALRGSGGTADWIAERVRSRHSRSRLIRVLDLETSGDGLCALVSNLVDGAAGQTR